MRREDAGVALDPDQARAAEAGMKAMIPVGRPFLDYVLSALADAGCAEACLVVGPEHGAIRERYTRTLRPRRISVGFAVQERPLGTADAVLAAEPFAGGERFLVVNADNYYPIRALRALRGIEGAGLAGFVRWVLLAESNLTAERVSRFPVARADAGGYLAQLEDGGVAPDDYVSMNAWLFTPAIFEGCRRIQPVGGGELEIQAAVRDVVAHGERFRMVAVESGVLDLTSRADVAYVADRLRDVEVRL